MNPATQSAPMKPTTPADASLAAAKASAKGKTTVQGGAPVRMSEATPAGRRKKRKASEKQTMEQVANFIPESALYNKLLHLERKVDATVARKRTHIQEALQKPERVTCKLRMYVFNAYSAGSATSGDTPTPPTWTLFICGRLMDIPTPGGESGAPGSGQLSEDHRFTKLIKRVSISLDPQQYPEDNNIVWESEKNVLATDGFEVKRIGSQDTRVQISITVNNTPERFLCPDNLVAIIGTKVDTRPRIISALWQYIKKNKLQTDDASVIKCDEKLTALFGPVETIKLSQMGKNLAGLLEPPPPFTFDYTVRCGGQPEPSLYDISVDIPLPLPPQDRLTDFLNRHNKEEEISQYNSKISAAIRGINQHKRRRTFFLAFSQSPVDFINSLIASQSRDLKVMAGGNKNDLELERRSDIYRKPWVEDAVIKHIYRQQAQGQS